MTELGMFVYPWEVADGGLAEFRRGYEASGCTAVAPALAYHHGNTLVAANGRVRRLGQAAVTFHPDRRRYGELTPAAHQECADAGVAEAMRDWCRQTNRHFSGWTVLLHNSTLGAAHPDACIENHGGDRYHHALCPANPAVREYALALVGDICDQLRPDSLLAESAANRTALHGDHHEIANVRVGAAAMWLLSLCFCPHCLAAAGAAGVDGEKARDTCGRALGRLLNSETAIAGNDWTQIAGLLLEYPELHAYQLQRQARVGEFVGMLSGAVRERGVEFRLITSSTPWEAAATCMEGLSFTTIAGLADVLLPLVYGEGETFPLVENTIRLLGGEAPPGAVLTLHPGRYPNRASFLGAVAEAVARRPRCLYVYNYSLASAERLGWLPAAAALAEGADAD